MSSSIDFTAIEAAAYCYAPESAGLDIPALAIADEPERWSDAGAPAIYLACDPGVLMAEWGRHLGSDKGTRAGLWRVQYRLRRGLDLRRRDVRARLGVPEDPSWFLDADGCRDLAATLRYRDGADGLLVPSVAFLDQPQRGNVVLFIDEPADAPRVIDSPVRIGGCRMITDEAASRVPSSLPPPTSPTSPEPRVRSAAG